MTFLKQVTLAMSLVAAVLTGIPADAATYSGKIGQVFTAAPGNYPYRVYLIGGMVGCADGFGYLDTSDGNYQAHVADILSAFHAGKNVYLFTDQVGAFCKINSVAVYL